MRGTSVGVHSPSRPASFERGMQRVVGADLHALAAANAAREKLRLVERARRTQQPFMAALAQAGVGAHQRNQPPRRPQGRSASCAGPDRARRLPSPCGRSGIEGCRAGNCPRSSCTSGTRPCATARRRWDRRRPGSAAGSGCTCRSGGVLVQPQHAPARDRAQQRAQRADRPAPQARHAQAGRQNRDEENAQHQALRKVRLAKIQHRVTAELCAAFRRSP
jgi:hypothetical protein